MPATTQTTASPPPDAALPNPSSRRWTTAALLLVMVLASMESTVTSTAMPTIVGALQGLEHYSWVMSIYLITQTATMLIYGRLADYFGRKRVLLFAIALFVLGSSLAAFSTSMLQLIIFRGIQGLGAGGIMPVVLTILGDIFTLQERAKIQGAFSAVWGSAALAGPMLGAFLVTTGKLAPWVPQIFRPYMGWPTIFWINLPLAIPAVLTLIFAYHDHHHHQAADDPNVSSVRTLVTSPAILPCFITSTLLGVGVFAIDVYVPLYVQGGRGMSAAAAAATVTPIMLAWASSGIFAAPLLLRWGFRKLGLVGAAVQVLGFSGLLLAAILHAPLWFITATLFITGMGCGPSSMAMLLAAQDAATYRQRGLVTAGIAFCRNLGGALGVLILGLLFNLLARFEQMHLPFEESDLLDPTKLKSISENHPAELAAAQSAISGSLFWVFVAMLLFSLVHLAISRLLPAKKSDHSTTPVEALEAAVG